jgi:precorrin-3B methylase
MRTVNSVDLEIIPAVPASTQQSDQVGAPIYAELVEQLGDPTRVQMPAA